MGLTIWGFTQGDEPEPGAGAGVGEAFRMFIRWLQKFLP